MFKKIKNFLNQVDFTQLTDFQKTIFYLVYSGNIRKG